MPTTWGSKAIIIGHVFKTPSSQGKHCPLLTRALQPAAKSLQSCPTLCDPIDGSPPGSTVPGSLQARTLQWVAISFSNAWKWNHSVMSNFSPPHGLQPSRLLCPWDFPGKSTGVGCHRFLRPWRYEEAKRYDTERWTTLVGGVQYASGEEQSNSSKRNEEAEPKQK